MRQFLRFLLAFIVAAIGLMAFRCLVFSVYTVKGDMLEPMFKKGDRILVNRWSYGLRTGFDEGIFGYSRICYSPVRKGDIVAFDYPTDSLDGIFVSRCTAIPGDTIENGNDLLVIPGKATCNPENMYWLESVNKAGYADSKTFGPIAESHIIGKVLMVVYNHDDSLSLWEGWDNLRFFRMTRE